MSKMAKQRCSWAAADPVCQVYHDTEWGVPVHNDRKLFEMLNLEGMQAGLSWITILRKRETYRKRFDRFEPRRIALYSRRKVRALLLEKGIVRNRLKVEAIIENARSFLAIQEEFGTFDRYIWQFVGGEPIQNARRSPRGIPTSTDESVTMSKNLKARGFRFVGPTICYAFMQATGMINDHLVNCFRYVELRR